MVKALVQNHEIVLQQGVVIFDADGNIVSTFGGGGSGLTDTQLRATPVPVSVSGSATEAKQDTQITAEQAILDKIIAAPATEAKQDTSNAALGAPTGAAIVTDVDGTIQRYLRGLVAMAAAGTINVRVKNGASFDIPAFNYQEFTYVGATNNVATQVFKSGGAGGTTVATLTFDYVAAGAADDDLIASITQS